MEKYWKTILFSAYSENWTKFQNISCFSVEKTIVIVDHPPEERLEIHQHKIMKWLENICEIQQDKKLPRHIKLSCNQARHLED